MTDHEGFTIETPVIIRGCKTSPEAVAKEREWIMKNLGNYFLLKQNLLFSENPVSYIDRLLIGLQSREKNAVIVFFDITETMTDKQVHTEDFKKLINETLELRKIPLIITETRKLPRKYDGRYFVIGEFIPRR